jgi:hypothetical protein
VSGQLGVASALKPAEYYSVCIRENLSGPRKGDVVSDFG